MTENPQTDPSHTTPAVTPAPDQAASAPAPAPAGPTPEEQLAVAKKDAAQHQERYLRAVADLENYRKRMLREKDELRQYAAANVVEDIIPVLDNLSLGMAAAKQQNDVKAIVNGVSLVLEQFKSTLGRHGLKEVNPVDQPFDHNLHESIAHQPSATVPAENVMQVVRMGYTLNGRLLRPASVIVSSGVAKEEKN